MQQQIKALAFKALTDLAAEGLGGKAIVCTDDFFCRKR
jgi:allantoicase